MAGKTLTLIEHINELKSCIIRCVLFSIVACISCYVYSNDIVKYVTDMLLPFKGHYSLVSLSVGQTFITYLKISMMCGIALSTPVYMLETYGFLSHGLTKKESKIMFLFFIAFVALFLLGSIVLYYAVLPQALEFLFKYQQSRSVEIMMQLSIDDYVGFVVGSALSFGVAFQIPLLISGLVLAKVITPDQLRKIRRYVVVVIFIVAAIITPPDIPSQIILGLLLMILYEITILIAARLIK
ncbi:twin-arginine translocase subunit TatC [Rickettsiales bacterium]|nr:twin-arginine translocase subunit TatC [Rickettsiales bacterium]